jgi:hypothetical protein
MSKFLQHKPCPHCRSRDNLAEYDDHFWCFGCRKFIPKDDITSVRSRYFQRSSTKITEDVNSLQCTSDIPQEPLSWLLSYGITLDEIRGNNISWCASQEILVLINLGTYWQGRCFGNQRVKYLSSGTKPLTIYGSGSKIVCVEDILSAIKISRLSPEYCAMPLLGSSMSEDYIKQLSGKFKQVSIWLDRDKAKQAISINRDLKQRGFNSRVIISELDPKAYNEVQLKEFLK